VEIYENEHDQVDAIKRFFAENGKALAVGVILGVGALVGWRYWTSHQDDSVRESSYAYENAISALRADKPETLADLHKARMQKAQKTAMNKLMDQIGKPYRWGGSSPRTGFDCSGLVYYAYKDLVKFRIPRTANEMYHLRDASPVDTGELQSGDLVFFRTQGRGTADHVGVYVGNGKFIQSPRSGQDIQITSLSEDYWQRHYVGARRVMTSKTLR